MCFKMLQQNISPKLPPRNLKTTSSLQKSSILFCSICRMMVCNQVMKFILDKIEKDEKQAAKRRKKEEVVEQKRWRQNASKLTALLYKHKEQLKAEILKKRALLDKELQLQVQVGVGGERVRGHRRSPTFHMEVNQCAALPSYI